MTKSEVELGPIFGPPIPVPRDERGRIRWMDFKETPNLRVMVIEAEARKLLSENGNLTQTNLRKNNVTLATGIQLYYPGQFLGLRQSLGVEETKRPHGYWTKQTIEAEAAEIYAKLGTLNQRVILKEGRSGLSMAIATKYPGKMKALLTKMGLSMAQKKDYWSPEQIEKTAQELLDEFGNLSRKTISEAGRSDFENAAHKRYPGGMTALRSKLGVKELVKPKGYWTVERMEQDTIEFINKFGKLSHSFLKRNGHSPLSNAIHENYPGGISALKEKLGIKSDAHPEGYWTPEKIEEEAKRFMQEYGIFSHMALRKNGLSSLSQMILLVYPGGTAALRTHLGLSAERRRKIEPKISKNQANTDLDNLFEEVSNG
jgi:hypothetical protein